MKKIIALILALACVFAVCSCGEDDVEEVQKTPEQIAVETTLACYAASVPTRIQTNTERVYGENYYTLKGEYITETGKTAEGLVITVKTYTQDKLRYVADGAGPEVLEHFYPEKGFDQFLEGKGRSTDGKKWVDGANFAPTAGSIALNITLDNITDITYTEAKYSNVMSFVVLEDMAAEVFGADAKGNCILDIESDVTVSITNNGAVVTGVTIEYTVEEDDDYPGQTVVIDTVYGYEIQAPQLQVK